MNSIETFLDKAEDAESSQTLKGDSKHDIGDIITSLALSVKEGSEKINRMDNLVFFGFLVLLVMVATMILMVLTLFIETYRSVKPQVIYNITSEEAQALNLPTGQ